MLIREFTEIKELKDIDLLDDLEFFMTHDPKFYRRTFFPMIARVRDHIKSGKQCSDTAFRSTVDSACDEYCSKFKIPGNPKSVFTDVDRDKVARSIFGKEHDNIAKGVYDKDES